MSNISRTYHIAMSTSNATAMQKAITIYRGANGVDQKQPMELGLLEIIEKPGPGARL